MFRLVQALKTVPIPDVLDVFTCIIIPYRDLYGPGVCE